MANLWLSSFQKTENMPLLNLRSSEKSFTYLKDGDTTANYFCRILELATWSNGPFYWYMRSGGFGVPLEFMFDGPGRLACFTIAIAGNVTFLQSPPRHTALHTEAGIPTVNVSGWEQAQDRVIEEKVDLQAWWHGEDLWIVRSQALPTSSFDTKAGAQILFNFESEFVGAVVVNLTSDERGAVMQAAQK